MEKEKIRFGVVGCGVIGPIHCEAIKGVPDAELVAVCDVDPGKATALGERYHVPYYTQLEKFLAHPDLQAVSICIPSGYHAQVGTAAARAGKHVLVEKPIDVSLEAADRLIAACQQAGVKLGVISQHRFSPEVVKTRQLVQEGHFGTLVLGEASIKWYRSQAYYDSGDWRGTLALDGGGAFTNQGIHYVDLLLWMMGPVTGVKAYTTIRTHQGIEVEDLGVATLRFASGALGTMRASTSIYPGLPERLEIHGEQGTAVIEADRLSELYLQTELGHPGNYGLSPDELLKLRQQQAAQIQPEPERTGPGGIGQNPHTVQVADFVEAIRENREPLVTGTDARRSLELILAIYRSARENREIEIA